MFIKFSCEGYYSLSLKFVLNLICMEFAVWRVPKYHCFFLLVCHFWLYRVSITGISQTTSNTTSSGGSNISSNSRFSAASGDESYPNGQILPIPNLRIFSFAELKAATKNFRSDTVLGEGGFGRVYKGWLDDKSPARSGSTTVIAVKKLNSESVQGFEEWQVILKNMKEKI